jgi:hypothetical protein
VVINESMKEDLTDARNSKQIEQTTGEDALLDEALLAVWHPPFFDYPALVLPLRGGQFQRLEGPPFLPGTIRRLGVSQQIRLGVRLCLRVSSDLSKAFESPCHSEKDGSC